VGVAGTTGASGATGATGPGAAAGAIEGVATGSVTTNSTVYVSLLGGPAFDVVIPASGKVLVILTGELSTSGFFGGTTAFMSVSLDNSVALDTNSLRVTGNNPVRASVTVLITGLTPGLSVNFAAAYKVSGNTTGTFNARQITVIPN
jgi:hypothetical protein